MSKTAATDHPVHELIARRWSPRAYSEHPVEPEKLLSILEAGRWAASCFNEQPWSYVIGVRDHIGDYNRLLSCLTQGNRVWAYRAPVLVLSVAQLRFARNDKINRHAAHDVGLSTANMMLQAIELGLYVHAMAGFDIQRAQETFAIPGDQSPVAMMTIGYLGSADDLPAELREREVAPRERKRLQSFVFEKTWGKPAKLAKRRRRSRSQAVSSDTRP